MSVETILQTIEHEIANLTQARNVLASLNGSTSKSTTVSTTAGRFSAASRAKMAAAQKARWAKFRASKVRAKRPNLFALSAQLLERRWPPSRRLDEMLLEPRRARRPHKAKSS